MNLNELDKLGQTYTTALAACEATKTAIATHVVNGLKAEGVANAEEYDINPQIDVEKGNFGLTATFRQHYWPVLSSSAGDACQEMVRRILFDQLSVKRLQEVDNAS